MYSQKNSLSYIENAEYGNFHFDGMASEFDNWVSAEEFTWNSDGTSYILSTRDEVGYDVIAIPTKTFHMTSNLGGGFVRGYYTGAIGVYIYSETYGTYSKERVFDFGDTID